MLQTSSVTLPIIDIARKADRARSRGNTAQFAACSGMRAS